MVLNPAMKDHAEKRRLHCVAAVERLNLLASLRRHRCAVVVNIMYNRRANELVGGRVTNESDLQQAPMSGRAQSVHNVSQYTRRVSGNGTQQVNYLDQEVFEFDSTSLPTSVRRIAFTAHVSKFTTPVRRVKLKSGRDNEGGVQGETDLHAERSSERSDCERHNLRIRQGHGSDYQHRLTSAQKNSGSGSGSGGGSQEQRTMTLDGSFPAQQLHLFGTHPTQSVSWHRLKCDSRAWHQ
jgi:hypothetical protein